MLSASSTRNQHDFKRTLSDDDEFFEDRYYSPRGIGGEAGWFEKLNQDQGDEFCEYALVQKFDFSQGRILQIGKAGWFEDLKKAFLHEESIEVVFEEQMEALLEFLQNQYAGQCRVKQLWLSGEFGTGLSDCITAVTHLNLESFSLRLDEEPTTSLFQDKGQCLVNLLEGENLTSLELIGSVEFEGLVEALESPKCHLSRLSVQVGRHGSRLLHAISSLTSLERLTLSDWDGTAAIELLATPHCNIWHFKLERPFPDEPNVYRSLADALQHPDCKLLKLELPLREPETVLIPFRRFCNALQSPNCKLQYLVLEPYLYRNFQVIFLQELRNACQTAHKLTSLMLSFPDSGRSNYDFGAMFLPNITRLALSGVQITNLLEALKHPQCRLRHLWFMTVTHMVTDDQANIVKFLERRFDCTLETLDFGYNWESDSLREYCSQILKRNKIYRHGGLADQLQVEPSNAKLFICGVSGAGKTTITENLVRRYGIFSCLQQHPSTYGIHLQPLSFGSKKLLICDLAGQKEFHAFHHYFVRGSDKDLFLVVCKAAGGDEHDEFENQLRYWLRFIVSHRTVCEHKPRVMVALNYFPTSEKPRKISMTQDAINRCSTLIQDYSEHINFGNSNHGLVATKVAQVRCIKTQLGANLDELLKSRPMIPKVCQDIMKKLNKPSKLVKVISVEDVKAQFGMQDVDEGLLKVSIMHLHDMGEVIYFEQETEEQLIVLDVQWFVQEVVGLFLPRLSRGAAAPNALPPSSMAIADVTSRLASQCGCQESHISYILNSLHRLGVLLPDPAHGSVKVLAFLRDQIENCPGFVWKAPTYTFWGRRFQCKDVARTLLPSGIFAMLQVNLVGQYAGCRIGEGWLHLVEDGIGVIVKVGVTGEWYDRQWIDVLLRIPFSVDGDLLEKADALFHKVKKCIFEICGAYNYGCPFIELEEKVIRPVDVENLQFTSAEVSPLADILHEANKGLDLKYSHTWRPSLQGNPVFEIMLPSERNRYFHSKLQDLQAIDYEVHQNLAQPNSSSTPAFQHEKDKRSNELNNAVQVIVREIRQSVNLIINEIKRVEMTVLKQMKILQDQGDQILAKLKLQLEFQWPRYPYISNADNVLQRFSEKVFGMSWKLHLLCEHGSCHHVPDQTGIKITDWPGWLTDVAPVLVPTLRLLFFIGKVAAIAYAGGAMPLPSPEPLFKSLEQAAFPSLIEKVFGGIDESLKTKDLHRMSPKKDELERFYQKFLNGKDLADDLQKHFGLYHVTSTAHEHAWVCERHSHDPMYKSMRGRSSM